MSSSDVDNGFHEINTCNTIEPKGLKHKKHRKKKESKRKSRRSHSSDSSSVSSSKRKRKKVKSKKHKKLKREKSSNNVVPVPAISQDLPMKSKLMKPMTKEEWEQQQSTVRRVTDPVTGKKRLIKGDGEVLEEIVSKDRHKQINKEATIGDGIHFQNKMASKGL